jgi:hypothetical protein
MSTVIQTRTNAATNPSFETASGTVTVRTNLALDPAATALTNWSNIGSGSGTKSVDTTVFHSGTSSIKWTMSAAGQLGTKCAVQNPGFATGDVIKWSTWVYPSSTISIQPYFERTTPTYTGGSGGAAISCPANTWTQLVGTLTLSSGQADPTGAFGFGFYPTTSWASTDVFYADEIVVERNSGVLGTYMDGNTPASGDYAYSWTGAPNASTSIMTAPGVASVSSANTGANVAACTRSASWTNSRGYSLRVTPTSTGNNTAATVAGSGSSGTGILVPGQTYTVSATFRQAAPQTGSLYTFPRAITYNDSVAGWGSTVYAQAPNVAGSTRLSITFTVPLTATWATVRLYNGALGGGGDVWWDDILIEPGVTTAGTYFDGATASSSVATYSPAGTWSYSWSAGADASSSTATLSIPLQDWSVQLPDGTIIGPGADATSPLLLQSITGLLQLVQGRGAPANRGQGDGATPTLNYAGDRVVTLTFGAFNPAGGMRPALAPLAKAFTRIKDPSQYVMTSGAYLNQQAVGGSLPVSALQVKLPGLNQLVLLGYPEASATPVDQSYSWGEATVTTQWAIPDGLLYESAAVQSPAVGLSTVAPGVGFPLTFNVAFGASSSNSVQVTNGGLYDAAPVYKITGPVTSPKIINAVTGQFLQLNIALGAGDVLVVDTQNKVVRLNGVNRNNTVAPGSRWFLLPPGTSTLQFASTDGTAVAGTLTAYLLNTYSTL